MNWIYIWTIYIACCIFFVSARTVNNVFRSSITNVSWKTHIWKYDRPFSLLRIFFLMNLKKNIDDVVVNTVTIKTDIICIFLFEIQNGHCLLYYIRMFSKGFYYEHNRYMLIACIEIVLSKVGRVGGSCSVYKTCIQCLVVNHKLKRYLQCINLSKNIMLEMR